MAHVGKRGFMACDTAVTRSGADNFPSARDRAENPKLAKRIWRGQKEGTLPELLGHGTGVMEALSMAVDGKVRASISGKTGQGHYGFAVDRIMDAKGRYDFKATLRQTWERAAKGSYLHSCTLLRPVEAKNNHNGRSESSHDALHQHRARDKGDAGQHPHHAQPRGRSRRAHAARRRRREPRAEGNLSEALGPLRPRRQPRQGGRLSLRTYVEARGGARVCVG